MLDTSLDGKTNNYHVLATDYTSYAIVYNCYDAYLGTSMGQ